MLIPQLEIPIEETMHYVSFVTVVFYHNEFLLLLCFTIMNLHIFAKQLYQVRREINRVNKVQEEVQPVESFMIITEWL